MVKLKTEVILPEIPVKLDYRHESMMMGSCFTESIGMRLKELCFPIDINPFGTLYNPVSIANSFDILKNGRDFGEGDIFYANGLWNSFSHHSRFSHPDKEEFVANINKRAEGARQTLRNCNLLFLTFGTSWVFEHTGSGKIVSNCHKLPASVFRHYKLTVSQIVDCWKEVMENLFEINPSLNIVFTVSPIRHLKDGEHENQLSKSTLLIAIDELMQYFRKERIFYFPSYEIVLDELRDYRFYAADLVHLTDVAIELIREKFSQVFIGPEERLIAGEIEKLRAALDHRPANPTGKSYRDFLDKQAEKISDLKSKYPFLDFDVILDQFHLKKELFNF